MGLTQSINTEWISRRPKTLICWSGNREVKYLSEILVTQFKVKFSIGNSKLTRLTWYSKTTGCGFPLGFNWSWIFFRDFLGPTPSAPSALFAHLIPILLTRYNFFVIKPLQILNDLQFQVSISTYRRHWPFGPVGWFQHKGTFLWIIYRVS